MTDTARRSVIGIPIDILGWDDALARISAWADARESRYVCICNVHSVVTARGNPRFAEVLKGSDLNTADGAPVAWLMRRLGVSGQQRINGPDLMWRHCELAAKTGTPIYLLGGSQESLDALTLKLGSVFPGLKIAGSHSPPYRPLTEAEEAAIIDTINRSGAGVVWVGLGCPKQELWMASLRGRVRAVMLGVGAAFDYHSGMLKRAPKWMQHAGLEWLYRLFQEPRRLLKRYATTNTLFIVHAARQLLAERGRSS